MRDSAMRVLVADDDFIHNSRLEHMLEAWGHIVQIARDAGEAIMQMATFVPDVVLTRFPITSTEIPPAILVTAGESVEHAAETVEESSGFWFLQKPVSAEALRVLLARAAEYGRLVTENERLRSEANLGNLPIRAGMSIAQAERVLLEATLNNLGNNKTHAARALGISAKTLHMKLRQYRDQDAPEPRAESHLEFRR